MQHTLSKRIALALAGVTLLAAAAVEAELTIPHRFQAQTRAIAAEVNANFDAIQSAIAELQQAHNCPTGMSDIGAFCIDTYEASLVDSSNAPFDPNNCDVKGACSDQPVRAHSGINTTPATNVTWFMAATACAKANKRLPTNQEWQIAALGTPDTLDNGDDGSTTCATESGVGVTGSRSQCVSNWGVYDMIGNVAEWTADWISGSGEVTSGIAGSGYGDSDSVIDVRPAQYGDALFPAVLVRGGDAADGSDAGVFHMGAHIGPSYRSATLGFRCAHSK